MRYSFFLWIAAALTVLVLAAFVLFPQFDLTVSGWFAEPGKGFVWADNVAFLKPLSRTVYYGSRALGVILALGAVAALLFKRPLAGLGGKAWAFLFLGLVLGPGLVANVVFKDNWGRARPRSIVEFGGQNAYTPPLLMHKSCEKNCSFVSGDAAFGFYLTSFAYVVPLRRSRRVFGAGMLLGALFGLGRLVTGAHFLSDVLFAAVFMLLTSAGLHSAMFGWRATRERWLAWFGNSRRGKK